MSAVSSHREPSAAQNAFSAEPVKFAPKDGTALVHWRQQCGCSAQAQEPFESRLASFRLAKTPNLERRVAVSENVCNLDRMQISRQSATLRDFSDEREKERSAELNLERFESTSVFR